MYINCFMLITVKVTAPLSLTFFCVILVLVCLFASCAIAVLLEGPVVVVVVVVVAFFFVVLVAAVLEQKEPVTPATEVVHIVVDLLVAAPFNKKGERYLIRKLST